MSITDLCELCGLCGGTHLGLRSAEAPYKISPTQRTQSALWWSCKRNGNDKRIDGKRTEVEFSSRKNPFNSESKMNDTSCLITALIPELGLPNKGKVRDIYEKDDTLVLIATDRISIFDRILQEPIRDKGRILTALSRFWFERTEDIISNHVIDQPDPNILVVKKCHPLPIEMVVRKYLVGSLWRDYARGARRKCGVPLPEGLKRNDPLPRPILTPSTKNKDGHDEDISKEELIEQGIIPSSLWNQLEEVSLRLFRRGEEVLEKRGIILLDTKYEFGLDTFGKLVLIDEIHTPDSSRFWFKKEAEEKEVRFPDKEFLREWAMQTGFSGNGPLPKVPEDIREKVRIGYREIYEALTGSVLQDSPEDIHTRIRHNLKKAGLILPAKTL